MNGYDVDEEYDEELADMTLELIAKKITKAELAKHLK